MPTSPTALSLATSACAATLTALRRVQNAQTSILNTPHWRCDEMCVEEMKGLRRRERQAKRELKKDGVPIPPRPSKLSRFDKFAEKDRVRHTTHGDGTVKGVERVKVGGRKKITLTFFHVEFDKDGLVRECDGDSLEPLE